MAMFCNRPLYHADRSQFKRTSIGQSLYTIQDQRYRTGDYSLTIYSLEPKFHPEDDPGEEDELPIEGEDQSNEAEAAPQAQGEREAQAPHDTQAQPPPDPMIVTADSSEGVAAPSAPPKLVLPLAYWATRTTGQVHPHAVRVGTDLDGGGLYVGRACLRGEMLAGKVAPRHRVCYVASEGREIAFDRYEVLVLERGRAEWVRCKGGAFPADALPAGITLQGRRVYSARAIVNEILTPGQLVVGESECRISYDVKEFTFPEYEVLVIRPIDPSKYEGALRHVHEEILPRPRNRRSPDVLDCDVSSVDSDRSDDDTSSDDMDNTSDDMSID